MNEYVAVALPTIIVLILTIVVSRLLFGNGLITKLVSVVMPVICSVAYVAFVLGKQGVTAPLLALATLAGVVGVSAMTWILKRSVIAKILSQSEAVLGVANSLSAISQQTAASAEEQATAVAEVTTSIEEIHRMSRSTTETAQNVLTNAEKSVVQGHEGIQSVQKALDIMEKFSQATDFVQVVGEVAEQSNLLAVNAGIEASKAGEFGRGFSVVASEVRNLAEQSKDAAKQIRDAIGQTRAGQQALEVTNLVLTGLGSVLQETSDRARQISGAAVQQSAGIKQISDAMSNLTQGGKDTAVSSQQIKEAAENLKEVTYQLSILVKGQTA